MQHLIRSRVFGMFLVRSRHARSASRRDGYPKFLKGKVTTLDDNLADQLGPAEEFAEMNRTLRKMFTQAEDIQSEEEIAFESGDYDSVYENPDRTFAFHEMNEKARRRITKYHIVKKKYFPEFKETNLLTYAAKKQVRYLHQLDPVEWTPERLSECFPISVQGAKKLLKGNFELKDEEKIRAHDAEVMKRWEMLRSNQNLSKISPVTLRLYREGKLVQDFYCGNSALPQPPVASAVVQETKKKKVGEYVSLVKKYLDAKQTIKQKQLTECKNAIIKTQTVPPSKELEHLRYEDVHQTVIPKYVPSYPKKSEMEDTESASFLVTDTKAYANSDVEVTSEEYKENLQEEFAMKKQKTAIDEAYLKWLEEEDGLTNQTSHQPQEPTETFASIQKFKKDNVELLTERMGNSDNEVAYLYDSNMGYQYPLGKDIIKLHIDIPHCMYKKGSLYRVGKCFYDDTGEFLYRVPILVNKS